MHVACFCMASELSKNGLKRSREEKREYVTKSICGSRIFKYLLSGPLQNKFAKSLSLDRLKVFSVSIVS